MTVCDECYGGFHSHCIEQGCYCRCQLQELIETNNDKQEDSDYEYDF